jgi:3',5'-cyclic AMP phosphodiesterase CpdA
MKKRRFIDILVFFVCAAIAASFVPVCVLYIKSAKKAYTNEEAVEKLKANTGEYFEFIAIGDNHSGLIFNDSATLKLIRRMNREDRFRKVPIDFVIDTGDVTFRGSRWDYDTFDKIRNLIKWPVISAMGNHDNDSGGAERFKGHIGRDEFSFADRNSYFIVLNIAPGELDGAQFLWFEGELKKSVNYQHRFVVLHKPPFAPYQQSWYRPELNSWSYPFMKLCEKYKVTAVFSGHEHISKKENFGGVNYVVSGGGGILLHLPHSDGGFLHYTVVKVRGDYVSFETRKIFPPLWEFLTYYMWKEASYLLAGVFF